jgi:hypothetical protein
MPSALKTSVATATTSVTTLYTCPASTTSVVTFIQGCNKTFTASDLTIRFQRSTVDYWIMNAVQVDPGYPVSVIDGQKLVLQAGDLIRISASAASTIDVILSVTELT